MAEVQVKNDFDTFGRQLQHLFEMLLRFALRFVPPFIKARFSSFYQRHLEGVKAVQKDGSTKETERISNLSYEEVIDTLEKCQKDDIKAFAYEFKKGYAVDADGNKIVNDDLGKQQSISKMEEITKANRKITQYTNRLAKYPHLLKNYNTRELNKWQNKRDKAIEKHEGYRYNIVFNKSRMGYMGERLAEIKSSRLGITKDEFYTEHPEAKEAVERAIDNGLELNTEELGEWAKEFVNEGDTSISNFKDDYLIHTVSLEEYSKIYKDLDDKSISYGVELNKSNDNKKIDTVNVYVHSKDIDEYRKSEHLNKGVLQSFGKKDDKTKIYKVSRKEEKETKDFILPRTSMQHYIDMFKGKDFTMNLNSKNEKTFTVRMTLDDAKEVLEYEKKRDKVQEKLDQIYHEKEIKEFESKIKELEKTEKSQSGNATKYENAIYKENIEKVPTSVNYDTLSTEVKDNLKVTYGFASDEDAKTYFNSCQLALGVDKSNGKMGVLITEQLNGKQQQFVYSNEPNKKNVVDILSSRDDKNNVDNKSEITNKSEDKEKSLFDKAVDIVLEKRRCTPSMLCRELQIGYAHSSEIVKQLEKNGIVKFHSNKENEENKQEDNTVFATTEKDESDNNRYYSSYYESKINKEQWEKMKSDGFKPKSSTEDKETTNIDTETLEDKDMELDLNNDD